MNEMTRLCGIDEIADGGAIALQVDRAGEPLDLILLRRGDAVHAYLNVCPHAGRRLDYAPGQFLVRGGTLICAAHGACFDVASGCSLGGPGGGRLAAVPIRLVDGQLWLAETET